MPVQLPANMIRAALEKRTEQGCVTGQRSCNGHRQCYPQGYFLEHAVQTTVVMSAGYIARTAPAILLPAAPHQPDVPNRRFAHGSQPPPTFSNVIAEAVLQAAGPGTW